MPGVQAPVTALHYMSPGEIGRIQLRVWRACPSIWAQPIAETTVLLVGHITTPEAAVCQGVLCFPGPCIYLTQPVRWSRSE